jgi:hypothetical protein
VNCYPFLEAEKQGDHNMRRACQLLKVSHSAYYADCGRSGTRAPQVGDKGRRF